MRRYLFQRLALFLPTLWGAVTLVFLFLHSMPGDPVDLMVGESAVQTDRDALRAQLGLDRPLAVQYGHYLAGIVQGDWGRSYFYRQPVLELVAARLGATVQLALAALLISLLISLPVGVVSAEHPNRWLRRLAGGAGLAGVSVPIFVLAPLLILLFSIHLDWLPVSGRGGWANLVLPALTLGLPLSALMGRMVRAGLIDVRREDYVRTARAKGAGPRPVLFKHKMANTLLPLITLLGLQAGSLLSGAVITETIFNWPGLGRLTIWAIQSRDYPLLQGCVLVIAVVYLSVNLLVDLLYGLADPRVRLGGAR